MKRQVLTAAVLAALASRATFAASEGGDTWSAVEAIQTSMPSLPQSAQGMGFESPAPECACEGSEGGDTWSEIASLPATQSTDLPIVATTGSLSGLQLGHPGELPSVNGTPLNNSVVDRIVRVGPKSRWINVGYGESVRFISQDGNGAEQSFSWRFDVSPEVSSVELNQLAPADFPEHDVRVFVSPNPLYAGG